MRVEFTEDHVPLHGIETTIAEVVELYGGEILHEAGTERRFSLPLRRGVAAAGGVECTISWTSTETVTLVCDREIDAPKGQRIALLVAGVIGALLFTMWPFFTHSRELGALAWIGGAIALAVWFLTLRKTSGGLAYDFLRRVADRQREMANAEQEA